MCEYCGGTFWAPIGNVVRGWGKTCSRACKAALATRISRSPEVLGPRFWKYVDKNGPVPPHAPELGPCWVWTGSSDGKHRGQLNIGQQPIKAPRIAWYLKHGAWPTLWVLHHCDNPMCVNDAHLYEGTNDDNIRDKMERGRCGRVSLRGSESPVAKLDENDVREIRAALARGEPGVWLAEKYEVSTSAISDINRGRSWSHLD